MARYMVQCRNSTHMHTPHTYIHGGVPSARLAVAQAARILYVCMQVYKHVRMPVVPQAR